MDKKAPAYHDVPRFPLINQYENEAKSRYQSMAINTVKLLAIKMNSMISMKKSD